MKATMAAALQNKWQELIRQQQQSRLSVSAFCRQHSFRDQSFYNWRKRFDLHWWTPALRRQLIAL
jgi:hypothetical protein